LWPNPNSALYKYISMMLNLRSRSKAQQDCFVKNISLVEKCSFLKGHHHYWLTFQ
jgi:hypothetical protein